VLLLSCSINCLGFVERHNTLVFLVLIFILAWSHTAENWLTACWGPCCENASSATLSEKSNWLILQLPTVTPSSSPVWLSIAVFLNPGNEPPREASINFQGGVIPYVSYNTESLIIKLTNKYICFYSLFKVREVWNKGQLLKGGVVEKGLRTTGL